MSTISELLQTAQAEAAMFADQDQRMKTRASNQRFEIARGHLVRRMKTVLGVDVSPDDVEWTTPPQRHPEIASVELDGMRFGAQVRGHYEEYDRVSGPALDERVVIGLLVCEQGHYRHRYSQDSDHVLVGDTKYQRSLNASLLEYQRELSEFRASCKDCQKAGLISRLEQRLLDMMRGRGDWTGDKIVIDVLLNHVYQDHRAKALQEAIDSLIRKESGW